MEVGYVKFFSLLFKSDMDIGQGFMPVAYAKNTLSG